MDKITFTRESLDKYKSKLEEAKSKGYDNFIWKGSLNNISNAKTLIEKLERSRNLSISI